MWLRATQYVRNERLRPFRNEYWKRFYFFLFSILSLISFLFLFFFSSLIFDFRLLLFQEKEQLLRELRSQRGSQKIASVQEEIKRLEQDLNNAIEISNQAIADR